MAATKFQTHAKTTVRIIEMYVLNINLLNYSTQTIRCRVTTQHSISELDYKLPFFGNNYTHVNVRYTVLCDVC